MTDKIKSVFRQREVEGLYELGIEEYDYAFNRIVRTPCITKNCKNVLSDTMIGTYDIDIPLLKAGDEFFLHNIEGAVTIKNVMRNSDGSTTYYIEDKIIETENTKKTKRECQEKIQKWGHEEDIMNELKKYKMTHPYKHRWFNFKIGE